MGNAINLTPHAVGELAGKDAEGFPLYVVVVKATLAWQQDGSIRQAATVPIREADEFVGEPATSGLLAASDLCPPKPRVDVLLQGTLTVGRAVHRGGRGHARGHAPAKGRAGVRRALLAARHGARHGAVETPPTQALPFAWELSFGGMDAQDSARHRAAQSRGHGHDQAAGRAAGQASAELRGSGESHQIVE